MRLIFLATLIVITGFSCSRARYIYNSPAANISYLQQKGDNKLTAYYSYGRSLSDFSSLEQKNNGFDIQAAYAVTNNWLLNASIYNRKEQDAFNSAFNIFDTSTITYKRHLLEIGTGIYVPLNPRKTITIDLIGNIAFGKFYFDDLGKVGGNNYSRYFGNNITKYALQSGINVMPSDYIRASFAFKFNIVHYGNSNTNYSNAELNGLVLNEIGNNYINFLEPTFNIEFGTPQIDWLKLSFSGSSTTKTSPTTGISRMLNGSIGLTFSLPKKKK